MNIEKALGALQKGRVVGVPTDTVYGLAVDPHNPDAVRALFDLKGRGDHLPLAVLAASFEQAEALVEFNTGSRRLVEPHWPGPLTAVMKSKLALAPGVGDHRRRTLAVRMPDHRLLAELLTRSGPLAVTSANRSGEAAAVDAEEARTVLGDGVAIYLPGGREGGHASTVVDLTRTPPRVLREGPVEIKPLR